ncbi:DUF4817 domain-containing protein [Trichonephila clavipes]|nr:DUF4817 domain-containing protein [Trichonephila clavipes]
MNCEATLRWRKTPVPLLPYTSDVNTASPSLPSFVKCISFKVPVSCSQLIFSQEQIAIVEFYFAIKSHCPVINAFQQKYPDEAAPNASVITFLVQRFRETGLVADRKRSGRAFIMKTKVADVEIALQSPFKRASIYINIITEFISHLKVMKGTLGCSKMAQQYGSHNSIFR